MHIYMYIYRSVNGDTCTLCSRFGVCIHIRILDRLVIVDADLQLCPCYRDLVRVIDGKLARLPFMLLHSEQ